MENSSRHSRPPHPKHRRSGYEPSDTETEWLETPWHDNKTNDDLGSEEDKDNLDQSRVLSPLKLNKRRSAKIERTVSSPIIGLTASLAPRRHSKSPYKPHRDVGNSDFLQNTNHLLPKRGTNNDRNASPFSKSERRRHVSPYKSSKRGNDAGNEEMVSANRKLNHRQDHNDIYRGNVSYSHRSVSAPRSRSVEKDQKSTYDPQEKKNTGYRTPSPLPRNTSRKEMEVFQTNAPSVGEINEMVANAKISRGPSGKILNFESTESISPGDIFFSRDYSALTMQKIIFPQHGVFETTPNHKTKMSMEKNSASHEGTKANGHLNNIRGISSGTSLTKTSLTSSSAVNRQSSSMSDASGRTTASMRKFTANRRKKQTETYCFCIKTGSCRTSSKSPEKERAFDEASFIEKAFVVESLREFWADKHQPASLNGFTCHKQVAQSLKQLVSREICPHIMLKGPAGAGKRALTMAVLREIYGEAASNISHDLRSFIVQETRPMQVVVPVVSSVHHVELNVHLEPNARYALMALVKQISNNHAVTPEISNVVFKPDYSVMVLYDVEKAEENVQHLIKWIMDCYTDACKLVLCCEDDAEILEPIKSRCEVIKVDAPVTHEIMEVLIQIARKEGFDLSMSFAAKIAAKSKQNLRKAIMALEACKAHNYPFSEDQQIPVGWEDVLVEVAAEILADPSQNRLFFLRGKFQKLLVEFVPPKLILQKLVEQFLRQAEASLKRELYYWHAYYDKRLPTGTSALPKLEEFVAKFMGIYRKGSRKFHHSKSKQARGD